MGSDTPLTCPICGNGIFTARLITWDDFTTRIVLFCSMCSNPKKGPAHQFIVEGGK